MTESNSTIEEITAAAKAGFAKGPFDGLDAIAEFYADEIEVRHGEPVGQMQKGAEVREQINAERNAFTAGVEHWGVEPTFTPGADALTIDIAHSVKMKDGSQVDFGGDKVELLLKDGKVVMQNHIVPMDGFARLLTPEIRVKMAEEMRAAMERSGTLTPEAEERLTAMENGEMPKFE